MLILLLQIDPTTTINHSLNAGSAMVLQLAFGEEHLSFYQESSL